MNVPINQFSHGEKKFRVICWLYLETPMKCDIFSLSLSHSHSLYLDWVWKLLFKHIEIVQLCPYHMPKMMEYIRVISNRHNRKTTIKTHIQLVACVSGCMRRFTCIGYWGDLKQNHCMIGDLKLNPLSCVEKCTISHKHTHNAWR